MFKFLVWGALVALVFGVLAVFADGPTGLPWRERLWAASQRAGDRMAYHFEIASMGEASRASYREGFDAPLVADWHFAAYRLARQRDRLTETLTWRTYRVLVAAPAARRARKDDWAR